MSGHWRTGKVEGVRLHQQQSLKNYGKPGYSVQQRQCQALKYFASID